MRELIDTLSAQYGIGSNLLVAAMHDCAAGNGVALRTLKIVIPIIVDVGCFSHTLDLVGDKFVTPCLSTFMDWWVGVFSHSPKSMLPVEGVNWITNQLMGLLGDVQLFLEEKTSVSPATREKLLAILQTPQE